MYPGFGGICSRMLVIDLLWTVLRRTNTCPIESGIDHGTVIFFYSKIYMEVDHSISSFAISFLPFVRCSSWYKTFSEDMCNSWSKTWLSVGTTALWKKEWKILLRSPISSDIWYFPNQFPKQMLYEGWYSRNKTKTKNPGPSLLKCNYAIMKIN